MRFAILTSDDIRHRYFVNAIRTACDVAAVGYQDTSYHPRDAALAKARSNGNDAQLDERTAAIVQHHFAERTRQEQAFFGHDAEFLVDDGNCSMRMLNVDTLSSQGTVDWLRAAGVNAVIVYGTSLIKPPLLDAFPHRMINMHLGLSPYYRGNATNFYPLVNDEPEYLGVTIHHLDAGIDSGAIIHQGRPDITAEDMPHTAGCKAILVGIELVKQTVRELEAGALTSTPQWTPPNARLYKRKDYHPSQVVKLYELIDAGLFPRYAARKHEVAPRVQLVP